MQKHMGLVSNVRLKENPKMKINQCHYLLNLRSSDIWRDVLNSAIVDLKAMNNDLKALPLLTFYEKRRFYNFIWLQMGF